MKIILLYLLVSSIITIVMILTGALWVQYEKPDNFLESIIQTLSIAICAVIIVFTIPYYLYKWITLFLKELK